MANYNTIPLKLETLTPVHIGSGNELRGNFEYVYFQQEEKIAVIDPVKVLDIIGEEHIDLWLAVIDQEKSLLADLPMLRKVSSKEIAQRIIEVHKVAPDTEKNGVKEQLFLGNGQATIPGSSLKGSVRTAILTKLIKDNSSFVQQENNLKNRGKFSDGQIMAEYMGHETYYDRRQDRQVKKYSPNKDLMRFFRISDFYFNENTCVVKNNTINLFRHGWGEKRELSSFWECIPSGITTTGNIQIPQDLIKRVQEKKYITTQNIDIFNIERLFSLINKHTLHLLNQDIKFWEDEDVPIVIGDYYEQLKSIQEKVKSANEHTCILRVGAGSGWDYMTGGWAEGKDVMGDYILEEDTWINLKESLRRGRYPDDMVFPKTRKMIDDGEPLGFVELTIL